MANEDHLAILNQGVEVWNKWREQNPDIVPDLIGVDFKEKNLSNVDFSKTILKDTDFSRAILKNADLSKAKVFDANLAQIDLRYATLADADLRNSNFIEAKFNKTSLLRANFQLANLSKSDFADAHIINTNFHLANLSYANLEKANLIGVIPGQRLLGFQVNIADAAFTGTNLKQANLRGQNISGQSFRGANLSEANLTRIEALGTNFSEGILTGACIEDWHINNLTNLNDIICNYIYLKENQKERRPHDPSKSFAPGEFAKLFQEAIETVDLIFSNGIDWQAFLFSFQKLKIECNSDELAIQAIERKSGNSFVVRVEVPSDANRAEVEKYLKREYEIQLKTIEDRYRLELNAKSNEIEIYRQQNANINEIVRILASKPINVYQTQANNMAGDRNIQIGTGNYVEKVKGNYIQGNYYAAGEKQSLAEAAAEIQELLKQLEKTNPTATDVQKEVFVSAGMTPTKKEKLINALKEGGKGAVEEFFNNPYVNVAIKIIEGWKNA